MPEANESSAARANDLDAWTGPGGKLVRLYESRWQPLFIVAALACGAAALRVAFLLQVPLPFCLLRQATGIPCPGCGATRSLLGWSHLNPLEALRFNPLFFAATLAIGAWAGAAVIDAWLGTRWVEQIKAVQQRWGSARFWIVLLAANWLYLWLTLPK